MRCVIFFVLSALLVAQATATYLDADKSDHFKGVDPRRLVVLGNETYYIGPKNVYLFIDEATRLCNDDGMRVISFDTEEKWELIHGYLIEDGLEEHSFWTSGRKLSGLWQWSGIGQEFTFTAWRPGQPDAYVGEICVYFTPTLGWWDGECTYAAIVICEF